MKTYFHISSTRRRLRVGFTLVEMVIALLTGFIVIAAAVTLSLISVQNFAAMANYVQMDDQSRNALDRISREARSASSLVAFSTNNPQYLQFTNTSLITGATVTYDANTGKLTLAKTGQGTQTLLTGCDSFSFTLFNRYPLITATNISFYLSTNAVTGNLDPTFCKVINMNWKCSRTILGSKLNTEIVQTAQVVLRNQVSQ
jgi:Tfp pilus assembly protein PilW